MATDTRTNIIIRKPQIEDAFGIWSLVKNSPPLDLNSKYSYMLFCTHFRDMSVVAIDPAQDNKVVGFVSGYRPPPQPDTLFVWQVAVDGSMRGTGLAPKIIQDILEREENRDLAYIQATVSPSNKASEGLFRKLAKIYTAACETSVFFNSEDFGTGDHEEEVLFHIGPIKRKEVPSAHSRTKA
ncbi:MAG: diaminobutyrate acetyltransferase [Desulfuromonas sp.]